MPARMIVLAFRAVSTNTKSISKSEMPTEPARLPSSCVSMRAADAMGCVTPRASGGMRHSPLGIFSSRPARDLGTGRVGGPDRANLSACGRGNALGEANNFVYSRNMETVIPSRLATLGHPQRLAVFRLLMRRYPDRVPAGELAEALGLKASTLSAYLSALSQAGLVSQERVGTSLRYRVAMTEVRRTFDYLLNDCCRGRPELCSPVSPFSITGSRAMADRKYKVLFLCTGNSARSIFAESILRKEGGDRFEAYSAGTRPRSELNPFALEVLRQKGHDVSLLRAKTIAEFQGEGAPRFDFVFTVCNQAANEDCPSWAGQPVSAHWGMPDPVKAEGTDAQKSLAFHQAYGALLNRINVFAALPIASLDRISLQRAVDDIGRTDAGASA
jgi:arsenate reductase